MKVGVVDLFCGAGGLSYGLKQAGLTVLAGADFDGACKYAFESNCDAKFLHKDIKELSGTEIMPYFKGCDYTVLAGCAPCQPFSTYAQSRKSKDERWKLLEEFQRIVHEVSPDVVTMENVAKLAQNPIWKEFGDSLKRAGYQTKWDILRCERYGVPQKRKRLVLIASKLGPVDLPKEGIFERQVTVEQAIGHLNALDHGKADPRDPLHKCSELDPLNFRRIRASKPGGTWRDWPEELRAPCHRKDTGKSYPSVYGRMRWDEPAPTMTTQFFGFGNGRFGHPTQDRAISLREGAILQSFPPSYKFVPDGEDVPMKRLGTLIGNAVPPKLGEAIGKELISHIGRYAA